MSKFSILFIKGKAATVKLNTLMQKVSLVNWHKFPIRCHHETNKLPNKL